MSSQNSGLHTAHTRMCQRNTKLTCVSSSSHISRWTSYNPRIHSSSLNALRVPIRSFSSNNEKTQSTSKEDPSSSQESVLTPGEKVVVGTRLSMYAGAFVLASCCAYFIGKELLPTKMSPNTVFDSAFHTLRDHPQVSKRFGTPLKAYGRDHGGHREGRRNFIE